MNAARLPPWRELRRGVVTGNGLARRLLLAVVLFSSLITAVITAIDLHSEYRRDVNEIDRSLRFIEASYGPSLTHSVWQLDGKAVDTQLEGLLHLPDIEYVAVEADEQVRWSAGHVASRHQRSAAVPLLREQGGQPRQIGTLRVVATTDGAIARVWSRLVSALVGNAVKTALVAVFVLMTFQFMVTRHLEKVAHYVGGIDPADGDHRAGTPLVLERPARGRSRPDVLDTVAESINVLLASVRQAHGALRGSEARLLALTAHSAVLIYEVDAEGRVTFASRGHDPPRRSVIGTLAEDWYPDDERKRFKDHLQAAFSRGKRQRFEARFRDREGAPRHYVITIAPMTEGDGRTRAAVTALDVTALKQAQDALIDANLLLESRVRERTVALEAARDAAERANRGKSEFLSRMSHELRTPMNAILGFAQLLEAREQLPTHRRWLGEIRRAGDHLLELIDELLDLARIEVGKLTVKPAPVAVEPVVQEAATMLRMAAEERGVALQVEPAGDALTVMADRTRLRQVLVNLLSNAVKYNRDGGRVTVQGSVVAGGHRVRLTVGDTGVGIAPEQLARLFLPFERLGHEDSNIPGSGIGLALSKRLAELMHGSLGAESVPGQGSSFWIELPAAAAIGTLAAPRGIEAPDAPRRALRVLYVEDHPPNVELMRAAFENQPHLALLIAEDGHRGVAVARAELP